MRLPRNFGSLLIGALIGGILVAATAVALNLLSSRDKSDSISHGTPGVPQDQQSSADDPNGTGDVDGRGDYTELLRTARDFEGTNLLYLALARIDRAELKELLERSKKISSPKHRLYVQRAIFQRFASLNPQEALRRVEDVDWQHRDAMLARVYAEWSISDLDGAVASIGKLDSKRQKVALESLLSTRDDLTDSHRQDLARSFDAEELAARLMNESQTFESPEDPEAAWNALTRDGFDLVSQLDLATGIATQWMEQSGFEVLPLVLDSIAGKSGYDILLERLIDSATKSNPQGLHDFALELDESHRVTVLGRISYAWGRRDPFAAVQALIASKQEVQMRFNLQMILRQWARSNPHEMFEKRSHLPRPVQLEGLGYALTEIAKTDPDQALQLLTDLKGEFDDTSPLSRSLVNGWAEEDPRAALAWVTSNSSELGSSSLHMLSDVLAKLAESNPREAFSIALSQPLLPLGEGIEVRLIRELTRFDLETAIDLLPQVREESRQSVYYHISYTLAEKGQSKRALELVFDLPESEQERYYNTVLSSWARYGSEDLFQEIENLSTEKLKSLAAYHLALFNGSTPVLTKEQLDHAKTFMKEREIERLKQWQD